MKQGHFFLCVFSPDAILSLSFWTGKKPLYIGKCQQRKLILHYTITTLVNGFPFTTDPCRVGDHIIKAGWMVNALWNTIAFCTL